MLPPPSSHYCSSVVKEEISSSEGKTVKQGRPGQRNQATELSHHSQLQAVGPGTSTTGKVVYSPGDPVLHTELKGMWESILWVIKVRPRTHAAGARTCMWHRCLGSGSLSLAVLESLPISFTSKILFPHSSFLTKWSDFIGQTCCEGVCCCSPHFFFTSQFWSV